MTGAVDIRDGRSPVVIAIVGRFDASAEALLHDAIRHLGLTPRELIFDVSAVDRLDVEGLLVLADHAESFRSRSCRVTLEGAPSEVEQLARLLGYERAFGLT